MQEDCPLMEGLVIFMEQDQCSLRANLPSAYDLLRGRTAKQTRLPNDILWNTMSYQE